MRNKRNETFARYLSNVLNYTVSGHQLETCTLYEFRPFNSNTQVQAGRTKGCPSAVYKILSETLKELTFDLSILMNFIIFILMKGNVFLSIVSSNTEEHYTH